MSFDPAPRPALRRATDATDASTHPTAPAPAAPVASRTLGGTTSDVLRPARLEKTAKLKVQIPRSLKAALEAQAKAEGVSVDALVTRALQQH